MTKKNHNPLLPCATCPWRVNRDAKTIPRYDQQKAVGLMETVGNEDGFRQIMACHNSTEENMIACKGYLAREGWKNLNVRILLFKKAIENPTAVLMACEEAGIELEPDYPTTLEKMTCSLKSKAK